MRRQRRVWNSRVKSEHPPLMYMTGQYGPPTWPSSDAYQKVALPRGITKRQAKAEMRLAEKGGAEYLNPRSRRKHSAA